MHASWLFYLTARAFRQSQLRPWPFTRGHTPTFLCHVHFLSDAIWRTRPLGVSSLFGELGILAQHREREVREQYCLVRLPLLAVFRAMFLARLGSGMSRKDTLASGGRL